MAQWYLLARQTGETIAEIIKDLTGFVKMAEIENRVIVFEA